MWLSDIESSARAQNNLYFVFIAVRLCVIKRTILQFCWIWVIHFIAYNLYGGIVKTIWTEKTPGDRICRQAIGVRSLAVVYPIFLAWKSRCWRELCIQPSISSISQAQQQRTMAAAYWARWLVAFVLLHSLLVTNENGRSFLTVHAATSGDATRLQKESKRAAENMKKQQLRTSDRKTNNPGTKSQSGRKNEKTSGATDSVQKKKTTKDSSNTKATSDTAVTGSGSSGSGKGKSSSNVFLGGELNRWNQGHSPTDSLTYWLTPALEQSIIVLMCPLTSPLTNRIDGTKETCTLTHVLDDWLSPSPHHHNTTLEQSIIVLINSLTCLLTNPSNNRWHSVKQRAQEAGLSLVGFYHTSAWMPHWQGNYRPPSHMRHCPVKYPSQIPLCLAKYPSQT